MFQKVKDVTRGLAILELVLTNQKKVAENLKGNFSKNDHELRMSLDF